MSRLTHSLALFAASLLWLVDLGSALAGDTDIIFQDRFECPPDNPAPFFDLDPFLGVILGDRLTESVPARDTCSDPLIYRVVSGPADLTIDAQTAALDWLPGTSNVGDQILSIEARDSADQTAQIDFTVSVIRPNSSPRLLSPGPQVAIQGELFLLQLEATDADAGDTLTFSRVDGPAGVTVDPVSGLLNWTPLLADLGEQIIGLQVSDQDSAVGRLRLHIRVVEPNQPPSLIDPGPQGASVGEAFLLPIAASDPELDPLAFALVSAPAGMIIDVGTGLIEWTPSVSQAGPDSVQVQVTDSFGGFDQLEFEVLVDVNRAPIAIDDAFLVERGETLNVSVPGVLGNDSDPNYDPLSALLESPPLRGSLVFNSDGSFDYTPFMPTGSLDAVEKFAVTGFGSGLFQPLLADMDGDALPEIVAASATAISIVNGEDGSAFAQSPIDRSVLGGWALADIDLDGLPEIVAVGQENGRSGTESGLKLHAFEHDGNYKWSSEALPRLFGENDGAIVNPAFASAKLTIADIDQDGTPEILVGHPLNSAFPAQRGVGFSVFNHEGYRLFTAGAPNTPLNDLARVEVVDLDLDGVPEIVTGSAAFSSSGEVIWSLDNNAVPGLNNVRRRAHPISANLDDDPYPELVREVGSDILALNHDGSTLWRVTTRPASNSLNPELLIADVDQDGRAEVLVAADGAGGADRGLTVLDGLDGSEDWTYDTAPSVSLARGGVSVLDLDRDGFLEVVLFTFNRDMIILDGRDGAFKAEVSGLTAPPDRLGIPLFADVDADGAAELVILGAGGSVANVFESPLDDWPPQRSIFNQWNYHVTNINADAIVPAFERPHWLVPGLNSNRIVERLPDERVEDRDAFQYRASDGSLSSEPATVELTLLPPNSPPRFLSEPRRFATPGFLYEYALLATDADTGDSLTLTLIEGPLGMSLSGNGLLQWTPSTADLGVHPVVLQVSDSLGAIDAQSFSLEVVPEAQVPDLLGVNESAAISALDLAKLSAHPIQPVFSTTVPIGIVVAQSPDAGSVVSAGSDVRIDVSQGPPPVLVPRLIGIAADEAQALIAAAGLNAIPLVFENQDDVPVGTVFAQEPPPASTVPMGSDIALRISGGPQLVVNIETAVLLAGDATTVQATAFDPMGQPEDPQPAIDLSVITLPDEYVGEPPALTGNQLTTQVATEGRFVIEASIPTRGIISTSFDGVVVPPVSISGAFDQVFSVFSRQIDEYAELVGALEQAIDDGDLGAIGQINDELLVLRDAIDIGPLRVTSPIARDEGVPPSVQQMRSFGFFLAGADLSYVTQLSTIQGLLQDTVAALADPTTPDSLLFALNQGLIAEVSALPQRNPTLYGRVDGLSLAMDVAGSRLPELMLADINALNQALVVAGLVRGEPSRQARLFSLGGVMSASSIRAQLIKKIYVPYMFDLVNSGALLIAGGLLQEYFNLGSLSGVITASSQAMHVFRIPNSVIEGIGFDTTLAEGNNVFMVGPNAIEEVTSAISGIDLPSISSPRMINDVVNLIDSAIETAQSAQEAGENIINVVKEANSTPTTTVSGCILSNDPSCSQLIYSNGFASVYEKQGGLQLPAPILIVSHNLRDGNLALIAVPFLPTAKGTED